MRKGALPRCLSMRQVGSCTQDHLWCLISGSVPSQLDEEEERRKRRREKNKVAAARCRNKKKERTEFLQRVSGAAAVGGASSLAGADVLCSQGRCRTLYNPEKVEDTNWPSGLDLELSILVPCGYHSVLEHTLIKQGVGAMSHLWAVDVAPGLATRKKTLPLLQCFIHSAYFTDLPLAPLRMTFDSWLLPPGT